MGKELIVHAAITSRGGAEEVILFETLCYLSLPSPGERGQAWHSGLAHRNTWRAESSSRPPSPTKWKAGATVLQTPVKGKGVSWPPYNLLLGVEGLKSQGVPAPHACLYSSHSGDLGLKILSGKYQTRTASNS